MSRLTWDTIGERYFETGVDRGVLYVAGAQAVPWNGLVSFNETPSGGEPRSYYQDGIKYLAVSGREDFAATLEAFTYPIEFEVCDGTKPLQNGLFATQQSRKPFGLTYRTLVGNDLGGVDHGYKIHIVYNALAAPAQRNNKTRTEVSDLEPFSWAVESRPVVFPGIKPTAHFVVDSRRTPEALLADIESILYGSDSFSPRLPSVAELVSLFNSFVDDSVDGGVSSAIHTNILDGGVADSIHTESISGGSA
jgi:hypothetical protein